MIHVLVVEDDNELNQAVCKHLDSNHYHVAGCQSAAEAYDCLYVGKYDLIYCERQLCC